MVGDYSGAAFADSTMTDAASTAAKVANEWNGTRYLSIQNAAWADDIDFYNSLG